MQPEERQEIIDGFRYTLQEFGKNRIDPMAKSMDDVGQRVIAHGEKIAKNKTAVDKVDERVDDVVSDVKDNRHGISKLWVWLVTALVTILTAVVGLVLGL